MSPPQGTPGRPETLGPFDVLVVGSGVAGLTAAVRLAGPGRSRRGVRLAILTKGELSQSATRWAQGGVAAVLGGDEDSTDLHLADTLAAGAGLCDTDAVRVLVDEGPERVLELMALGARFDRETSGTLALALEGGHSRPRVVHAGGAATGAEVERALVQAARDASAAVLERWFALDLLVDEDGCRGVVAMSPEGRLTEVLARHVVLATGGSGQLFAVTTNPIEATGDGIAMALRSGAAVSDLEFVQFHPTALHHPAMPRPLLSEALRGHGALLRDATGERFVDELAPRDVVSRAMAARMSEEKVDHLWLDATGLERFDEWFPTIAASLAAIGLDPAVDWLPIAPAAHYLCGGVVTDLRGATSLEGLWAAGEVACTGVHGANRLASNSLLEGMVFGSRLAEAIEEGVRSAQPSGVMAGVLPGARPGSPGAIAARRSPAGPMAALAAARSGGRRRVSAGSDVAKHRELLQSALTGGAGVVRTRASLAEARLVVEELADTLQGGEISIGAGELANLVTVAGTLLVVAAAREETRGAHARADFPVTREEWRCRLVVEGRPR